MKLTGWRLVDYYENTFNVGIRTYERYVFQSTDEFSKCQLCLNDSVKLENVFMRAGDIRLKIMALRMDNVRNAKQDQLEY